MGGKVLKASVKMGMNTRTACEESYLRVLRLLFRYFIVYQMSLSILGYNLLLLR